MRVGFRANEVPVCGPLGHTSLAMGLTQLVRMQSEVSISESELSWSLGGTGVSQ